MTAIAAAAPAPRTRLRRRDDRTKYYLIAPAVFVMLAVGLFPFFYSVVVSFEDISLYSREAGWAGLVNYERLFADARLWRALFHTALITAIALPLELAFGLLMAYHFLEDGPGKRLFLALLIIPSVISPIVAGSMWRLMFDTRFGPINQMIGWVWGEPVNILWTIQAPLAYVAIVVCEVWEWTPFMFLILLAALSNVSREQLDAAALDGAGAWRSFRHVALPAIWPVVVIALLIRGLDLARLFDIVWQLTKGGPDNRTETISIYMFLRGFQEFETSYTGAMVVLLTVLLSAVIVVVLRRVEIAR